MRTVKIAVASVLMTAALYGCSKGGEAPAPQAPPVTVATPLARQVVDWDEVTGRFEATRSVDVRARVGGYIQAVHFKDGDFVRQDDLDMSGKITDEAIHTWLQGMDMDQRRELVDTLYHVVDASQAELVTDLVDDWRDSAVKALEAIRELDPQAKANVRRMLRSLFSSGAGGAVRTVLSHLAGPAKHGDGER